MFRFIRLVFEPKNQINLYLIFNICIFVLKVSANVITFLRNIICNLSNASERPKNLYSYYIQFYNVNNNCSTI